MSCAGRSGQERKPARLRHVSGAVAEGGETGFSGRSVRGSGTFLANYNLGVYYQVFGNIAEARRCLEAAAAQGYEPAAALLEKISGK